MRNKSILAALLAMPLLLLACDRAEQSPTAAHPAQEKQAMTPGSQDKMLERSPSAAGTPAPSAAPPTAASPAMPPDPPPASGTPSATSPNEPKKAY